MTDLVVAVDIGSSRVHAGIVDIRKTRCLCRADFLPSETTRRLPHLLGRGRQSGVPAVISGGRNRLTQKIRKTLAACGVRPVSEIGPAASLPVRFRYDRPAKLGADRIADTLYAAAAYPKRNAIIIDSGTAITVDAVTGGAEFTGGVILAGIGTQLCGLHASTATLPLTTIPAAPIPFPGGSTEQCLRAGAVHGTAGALNHLVRSYRRILGGKCVVLATGGAWHVTKNLVDFNFIEIPDMTLIGTALYYGFSI
jgi:type III pantothenate kinase